MATARTWRRIAKWTLTVIVVLQAAVWFASGWVLVFWHYEGQRIDCNGAIGGGQLWVFYAQEPAPIVRNLKQPNTLSAECIHAEDHPPLWRWNFRALRFAHGSRQMLDLLIPAWLPAVLCGLPMAWLWWIDRRVPGRCETCNYDLIGLTSTRCPECGCERDSGSRIDLHSS